MIAWVALLSSLVLFVNCNVIEKHLEGQLPVNPEEIADLFEGDIQLGSSFRNAVPDLGMTWVDGVVPYVIDPFADYGDYQKGVLQKAMDTIEEVTAVNGKKCVQFVPRKAQRDYLKIKKVSGCSSKVGRTGGQQEVSLVYGCFLKGTVMHELLHALGLWHEQSRADRDDFVTIMWDNIKTKNKKNFEAKLAKDVHHLGQPYDYDSIMHYSDTAFTKDGKITILAHDPYAKIGQRDHLSPIDIKKVQILYGCIEGDRPTIHTKDKELPGKDKNDAVFHCDFEDGWCGIKPKAGGDVSWELDSSKRKEGIETGPDGDHTSGSGTYAVVRNRDNPGTSARVRFPSIKASDTGYCIDIWYNLYGESAGMMIVNDGNTAMELIFGDQGGDWIHGQYTVRTKADIDINVEAVWGPDYIGDVAIDDVAIFEGPC